MSMALSGTGTAAIPINPADVLSVAWWARKDSGGGPTPRVDWTWYNAAGAVISSQTGGVQTATSTWARTLQQHIVAPALRTDEHCVGKEGVRTVSTRWSTY